MSDINLLPEDLKKKEKRILENRDDFDLDEIEFTSGEKLKKEKEIKAPSKVFSKWFKPKLNPLPASSKNNNKNNQDNFKINKLNDLSNLESSSKSFEIKESDDLLNSSKDNLKINLEQKNIQETKNKDSKSGFESDLEQKRIKNKKSDFKELKSEKEKSKKKTKNIDFKKVYKLFKNKFFARFLKNKSLKNKKDIDVNLLPFGANVPSTKKIISVLLVVFIVSSVFVFAVYFFYYLQRIKLTKNYNNIVNEFNVYIDDVQKYDDLITKVDSWQNITKEIKSLLKKHIYWTSFFEKLEKVTLDKVQYLNFASSVNTSVTLQASAPDYETVAKQWIHFQNAKDFIKNVKISGISMSSDDTDLRINFLVTLEFTEDAFNKNL